MVVPFDSVASFVSSKQVSKGIVVTLSKSTDVTSGMLMFVRTIRLASVIPVAALTIGLALLTIRLKDGRRLTRNLNLGM